MHLTHAGMKNPSFLFLGKHRRTRRFWALFGAGITMVGPMRMPELHIAATNEVAATEASHRNKSE